MRAHHPLGGQLLRIAAAAVGCLVPVAVVTAEQGEHRLEGDPFGGRILFAEKRCVQCHAVWGRGGSTAPDIVRVVAGKPLAQLIGEFWNHTPRMIDEMGERGYQWPTLNRREMADIVSYLYYLRLFDDPGDPARGAAIYARLDCGTCHTLAGEGGKIGGSLDRFSAYPSPVPLAQAMWNSGPEMRRVQAEAGVSMPELVGAELVDIHAHIRKRGLRPGREVELLPIPDPTRGARLFRARRCDRCHEGVRSEGPDLGSTALRLTVGEISGILWNHSYAMQDRMQARGIPVPRFEGSEMADIISYLHFLDYMGRPGDPDRGAGVFVNKGCVVCHQNGGGPGPELAGSASAGDTLALAAAMWNHAPQMHRLMADLSVPWPRFEPGDMEDLAAFLLELSSGKGEVDGP